MTHSIFQDGDDPSNRAAHNRPGPQKPRAIARAVPRRDQTRLIRTWFVAGLVALAVMLAAVSAQARGAPDSFADLAEKLLPTVVNISTTQTLNNPERMPEMPQFPPGSPFEDFFKEFFERHGQNGQGNGQGNGRGGQDGEAMPRRATSLGSGFIIDASGLVVTNNHVIADADEVTVILHDDTALKAEVLGRDPKTDLALLRVKPEGTKLQAVSWGDSNVTRVGDWVVAIGNPFGLGGTVTAGIVSARARDINSGPYDDFLQTDAAINRGNSGGPMFNLAGEVIGINTAIFSPSGGSIGIGFAIPSTLAKSVIDDLKDYGRTRRGWLGVRIQSMTDEIAQTLGMKSPTGALVASVAEDGPAAKAGIKAGDVILTFDGKEVAEMRRLPRIVAETDIEKKVDVTLWRDGAKMPIKVMVGELEEAEEPVVEVATVAPKAPSLPGQTEIPAIGAILADIDDAVRQRFNLAETTKGVAVIDVKQGGPAADKGLRPGDIIAEVALEPVTSAADVAKKIEAAKAENRPLVLFLVEAGQGPRMIALRLDKNAKASR